MLENDGKCPTGILSVAHVLSEDRTGQGSGFMAISIVIRGQNWGFLMFNTKRAKMGLKGAGEEGDDGKDTKAVGKVEDKGEDKGDGQTAEGPHDTNLPAA